MIASLLLEPGRLELRDIEIPEPGPGEVVVRVRTALTCGTDLKAFRRGHPKMTIPGPFGHEFSGDVHAVGEGVTKFQAGDQIMTAPSAPCGECIYCKKGQENLCKTVMDEMVWGAFAEYVCMPAHVVNKNMYLKPEHLSYEEAAMLEPLSCVVYGMDQVEVKPDDSVLIIGAGAIGLMHVMVARALGAEQVIVAGKRENRLKLAAALGADTVIDVETENTFDRVKELTNGLGADIVIECTGQLAVWEETPDLARPGGSVILFGGLPSGTKATFDTSRIHYDQITLKGVFHYTRSAVKKAYQLLSDKQVTVSGLISGTYSLNDLRHVFEDLLHQGKGIKFAVVPDQSGSPSEAG